MKLIFVRHGDPDYKNDSLTEKGWREAKLLAERISTWEVTDFYCSPLGRAKATASCTLEKMNRTAKTLDWTQEFFYPIDDPVTGKYGVPWDFVPSYWTGDPLMFSKEEWVYADVMKQNPVIPEKYQEVCHNLDALLKSYGYIREDKFYHVPDREEVFMTATSSHGDKESGNDTDKEKEAVLVIFCHLGAICIMLSHLLNIPFPLLVHGFFLPTTSVTVVGTEERWGKEAYFRVQALGDVNHLLFGKEPISRAGSFAEPFQEIWP